MKRRAFKLVAFRGRRHWSILGAGFTAPVDQTETYPGELEDLAKLFAAAPCLASAAEDVLKYGRPGEFGHIVTVPARYIDELKAALTRALTTPVVVNEDTEL
jgi:hypothetical protein